MVGCTNFDHTCMLLMLKWLQLFAMVTVRARSVTRGAC